MEQLRRIPKNQVIMSFVATSIETTARYLGISYSDVFHRMERVGMIDDYILPNYEPSASFDDDCRFTSEKKGKNIDIYRFYP